METLLHNLVQATGWSIFHSLWQGALIYTLFLPFQMKELGLSARLKYAFAYGSLCLTFVCFVFTFILSFQWSVESSGQQLAYQAISILPALKPSYFARYTELFLPYLVFAYSLGLIIQCIIVFQGYRKVQQLKNAAFTHIPQEWKVIFKALRASLNIKKQVDFRLSDRVNVPLVIGFFKPVILFPVALAAQMNIKQVETILIHELSHIRRNDYAFNLIRTIINTFLFFNPFVWFTGRFINIEREHACDDLVLKLTHTPLTYAHALLTLELITDKSNPAFALAATGNNQHLYQRIKRITDMKTSYVNSKQKLVAITLTFATIVSLAWIKPSSNEPMSKISKPEFTKMNQLTRVALLQDTIKKKNTKNKKNQSPGNTQDKITVTGGTTSDQIIRPIPPVPPAPQAPLTPATPLTYPVPPMPEAAVALPISPAPLDMAIDIAPIVSDLSNTISEFSMGVANMAMTHFNGENAEAVKKMQTDIQRKGVELQRKFNSAEQQAKWQKVGAEMKAKFDSPEQRAKWEKIGIEMKAKFDNPEQRAKWEKMAKETEARINSPEHKEMIRNITVNAKRQAEQDKKMFETQELKRNSQQIVNTQQRASKMESQNGESQKLKNTAEYIELKKKFDKDVEELLRNKTNKE